MTAQAINIFTVIKSFISKQIIIIQNIHYKINSFIKYNHFMKILLLNSSYYVMNYKIVNNNYVLSIKENFQYLYFFLIIF